jgi:hypothetical protein
MDVRDAYIRLLEAELAHKDEVIRDIESVYGARVEPKRMYTLFDMPVRIRFFDRWIPIDSPELLWRPYSKNTDYGEVYAYNTRLICNLVDVDHRDNMEAYIDLNMRDMHFIECSRTVRGGFDVMENATCVYMLMRENAKEVIRTIAGYREFRA